MLNANNNDCLGIIYTNSYDDLVPELVAERSMASIPFAGRYRLCDFLISSMVHSGISNISFLCQKNYHSLMDHLGSGQEFDLARKNGGLNIVPPFAEANMASVYHGRVEALESIKGYLKKCKEKYVLMTNANLAINFDFRKLVEYHVKNEADVTIMYHKMPVPRAFLRPSNAHELYYTLSVEEGRVNRVLVNDRSTGDVNFNLGLYLFERERLIELVEQAYIQGQKYLTRDVLASKLGELRVFGYDYEDYGCFVTDLAGYFRENMDLLNDDNCKALFEGGNAIYTKVRDDNPTVYLTGARISNSMVADGCVIEGEVENSMIFRGVKIKKGAKVKNCVIMQDTEIGEGADLSYVIADKDVTIGAGKTLTGNESYQVFVSKGQTV